MDNTEKKLDQMDIFALELYEEIQKTIFKISKEMIDKELISPSEAGLTISITLCHITSEMIAKYGLILGEEDFKIFLPQIIENIKSNILSIKEIIKKEIKEMENKSELNLLNMKVDKDIMH